MNPDTHIVVVDDHKKIREPLAQYLKQNNYRVSTAANGLELNKILEEFTIDLLVLDILMPGEDGLEICQRIRATHDIPIILLTARTEDTDIIVGLEIGADDYVTKPFNPRELLARIKTVLRRAKRLPREHSEIKSGFIFFEYWILEVNRRILKNKDSEEEIRISTVEFKMLMAFLGNPNIVLSRDQLLDMVSNRESDVFDRSIDNQVSRLRKKIEQDPKNPTLIKTIWGGGYMFTAEVVKG